jgi:DNA-binding response OmpR family regulator
MLRRDTRRILCISQSPSKLKEFSSAVSSMAYEAVPVTSPQQAVACCSSNPVTAVVMDSEFLTDTGWSVARSLKMVSPSLIILLLEHGHNGDIPDGIDAVATTLSLIMQKLAVLVTQPS